MDSTARTRGGCLCGAVRYSAKGRPKGVGNCHCIQCRKATGAAFATFAQFAARDVRFGRTKAKYFRSSKWAERGFCRACGGTLSYRLVKDPGKIWLAVGSIDDPSKLRPRAHIFTKSMLPWVKLADRLPRFKEFPPT
ncbi:MAG: GFA family protein [Alphaproteobacteria bacterium]